MLKESIKYGVTKDITKTAIREGLSYGDVLLVPKRGVVKSRRDVDTSSRITKNITLATPLVSANMDTVTEHGMAIALAKLGGLGIIHQFMPIEEQVEEVKKVKRATSYKIVDPFTVNENMKLREIYEKYEKFYGFLVVNDKNELVGILSKRDVVFEDNLDLKAKDLMTKNVITTKPGTSFDEVKKILKENRIEKLPLLENNEIKGLITSKDIRNRILYPNANRDEHGRFLVAAAVGVKKGFIDRAEALLEAGADIICVDMAHGHSDLAINTIRGIKEKFPEAEILAGNIATAEAAQDLIEAGADGLKVGVGPGSACSTRIVAGTGVPQVTAVMDVVNVAKKFDIPVMADGGIKTGGDIAKAIVAGAETVLIGGLFAATDESPGNIIFKDNQRFKLYRGSASTAANLARVKREKKQFNKSYTAEGVDTLIPYRGSVTDIFNQLIGGLCSGISYCGARNFEEARINGEFIKITHSGMKESKPSFTQSSGIL